LGPEAIYGLNECGRCDYDNAPFLEEVTLELSEMPEWVLRTIPALGVLNNERNRKRLAELPENPKDRGYRQPAIGALTNTGSLSTAGA